MLRGYVYILTNRKNGTLYIGVTRNIQRRVYEHKNRLIPGFARKYGLDKLVYVECYDTLFEAIAREKQLKKWKRKWKVILIEENNPRWDNLAESMEFVLI